MPNNHKKIPNYNIDFQNEKELQHKHKETQNK